MVFCVCFTILCTLMRVQKQDPMLCVVDFPLHFFMYFGNKIQWCVACAFLTIWCTLVSVQKQDPMVYCWFLHCNFVYLDDRSETRSNSVLYVGSCKLVYFGERSETRSNCVLYDLSLSLLA